MLGILRYPLRRVNRSPATKLANNIKAQATNRNPLLLNPQGLRVFVLRYNNANRRKTPINFEKQNGDYQLNLTDLLKLCSWNKTFATLMLEGCLQRLPEDSHPVDYIFDNEQEIEDRFSAIFNLNKQQFTILRAPNEDAYAIYFWLTYRIFTRFPELAFTTLTQIHHWKKFNHYLSCYESLQKNFTEVTHSAFELYNQVNTGFRLKPRDFVDFYLAQSDERIRDYTQRLFNPGSYFNSGDSKKFNQTDFEGLKKELHQQQLHDKWLIFKKAFHWLTGGRLFRTDIIRHTAIRLLESCVIQKLEVNKQKEKNASSVCMAGSRASSYASSLYRFSENDSQTSTYLPPVAYFHYSQPFDNGSERYPNEFYVEYPYRTHLKKSGSEYLSANETDDDRDESYAIDKQRLIMQTIYL